MHTFGWGRLTCANTFFFVTALALTRVQPYRDSPPCGFSTHGCVLVSQLLAVVLVRQHAAPCSAVSGLHVHFGLFVIFYFIRDVSLIWIGLSQSCIVVEDNINMRGLFAKKKTQSLLKQDLKAPSIEWPPRVGVRVQNLVHAVHFIGRWCTRYGRREMLESIRAQAWARTQQMFQQKNSHTTLHTDGYHQWQRECTI